MKPLFPALLVICLVSFGCASSNAPMATSVTTSDVPITPIEPQLELQTQPDRPQSLPGEWQFVNGSKVCNGYLTRVATEFYCEAEAPVDWRAFSYGGQTFYYQRLTGG